jgi:hypothetical protein
MDEDKIKDLKYLIAKEESCIKSSKESIARSYSYIDAMNIELFNLTE